MDDTRNSFEVTKPYLFALRLERLFCHRAKQVDGRFLLQGETYLVESKWHSEITGASDMLAFHRKLEQKAASVPGLLVSNSGFTADGLAAFGQAFFLEGLGLLDLLDRQLPLNHVLERKVRPAAESELPFEPVCDIFA